MKRVKKQSVENDLAESAKIFGKIGTKQVVGHARIKHANQDADNIYMLQDGSEVMEDDAGKKVKKLKTFKKRKKAKKEQL
jgi:hypothetical protein